MTNPFPKISIVTPSFNQAPFLEETLDSVLGQHYPDLEYIVIDGGSTDGSVEIIKRYEKHLAFWVSEKDRGQVDAINKGIARATGEILGFLNSDDLYLPGAFSAVAGYFVEHPNCEWLCGDTIKFGVGHRTSLIEARVPKSAGHVLSGDYNAPQPGMFWKRVIVGQGFNEELHYCFDHELYARLLNAGARCEHLAQPLAAYRLHDESKTVALSDRFEREFDEIALRLAPSLPANARRWCISTQMLRRSYEASLAGDTLKAGKCLARAAVVYPEAVGRRPFWGCLKRLFLGRTTLDSA